MHAGDRRTTRAVARQWRSHTHLTLACRVGPNLKSFRRMPRRTGRPGSSHLGRSGGGQVVGAIPPRNREGGAKRRVGFRPRLHPILLYLRPSHLPGFGPALAHIFMTDPEEGRSLGKSLLGTGRVARSAGWGTPARLHPILLGLRPSHLPGFGPALAHIFMTDPEEGRSLGQSLLGTGRVARSAGWGLPAKAPPHPARPAAEPPSPFRGRIDAAHLARKKMCANASRNGEGGAKRRVGYSGKGSTPSDSACGRAIFSVSGQRWHTTL